MKKLIICSMCFFFTIFLEAQETFYKAISNIIVADTGKGTINTGINYEFQNKQAQLVYNLTEKYFVFGTYNFDNSSTTYTAFLGSKRTIEKQNSGYSFGGGIQKLGRIGNYRNLEVLMGFETQKVNNFEFSPNYHPEEKDYLIQNYYKFFAQFNMMKSKTNFDFGYSLKFAYLKFTLFEYNNSNYFDNKSIFLVDPTLNFNYKFLPKKKLVATTQIGISTALNNLEYSYGDGSFTTFSTEYLISPILKFGIQYKFNVK